MRLTELLNDPQREREVIADAEAAIDAHVTAMDGVKGRAIGGAYGAVKKLAPDFVPRNIEIMLPDFARVIEPHVDASEEAGGLDPYFAANADTIAGDLLGVTDARAANVNNPSAVKIYEKMRGSAQGQLVQAMPSIADFVGRHTA